MAHVKEIVANKSHHTCSKWEIGSVFRLVGLKKKPYLNGKLATIIGGYVKKKKRWIVKLCPPRKFHERNPFLIKEMNMAQAVHTVNMIMDDEEFAMNINLSNKKKHYIFSPLCTNCGREKGNGTKLRGCKRCLLKARNGEYKKRVNDNMTIIVATYCCKHCQKINWPQHKTVCTYIASI